MIAFINDLYRRLTIENGLLLWLLMALFIGASLYLARDFKLDASAHSLVLEGDQDLRYYRGVRARYGSDDFLFVTYTPREDLFSDAVLADLKALRDELAALERVKAVTSLLDVPLIESPPITFSDLSQELRTLEAGNVDREMARNELRTSPLYSELLLSRDGTTTALKVDLKRDERYISLLEARERLRELELRRPLEGDEAAELERVSREFREH
ncbi:MAG: hypothetical protein B0D86_00900, partial [Candidatus Sedimenticola endophacoides]